MFEPDEHRMAPGQRGMGRGLAAILPRSGADVSGLRELPLELVDPNPDQPRREFDEEALLALADSIRTQGLLQPVVARPAEGGRYELLAGERRLRAARLAELERIPAVVREAADSERLELAVAENVARVDLNPVEEARACSMLVEDLGLSKGEVGKRIGKSRVAVSNLIRLLDLPDEVLDMVSDGSLAEGHGRAILTCPDHEDRKRLAREARDGAWSVRETERQARPSDAPKPRRFKSGAQEVHPDLAEAIGAAEDALSTALGRPVNVRPAGDGIAAQIRFDDPGEALELSERLLRRQGTEVESA